jgi:uncharacterized membrane protein YfcA
MPYIILFIAGIFVGTMNAIAGGGMLLGFPVLLAMGLPPLTANVTGNVVLLPGQLSAIYGYRNYLRKVPKYYVWLLIPCLAGGVIGAMILRHTSSGQFQDLVPGLVLFAVVLFAFQPLMHFHLHRHMRSRSKNHTTLLFIAAALLPTAIYGGYFGAGLGFIMLAFLGFTKIRDVHQMNALKNVGACIITVAALLCLLTTHLIDWRHGLVMAAGNTAGGYYGALFAQRLPTHALRVIVIIVGVSAAAYLGLRNY